MRRRKNMPLILVLGVCLLIFLVVNAIRNIKVYIVYSSGIMPLLFIGFIIIVIVVLYSRRS